MSGFETPEGIRLQKVLSAAGVASRRVIEQYIVEGRIRVNGETAVSYTHLTLPTNREV